MRKYKNSFSATSLNSYKIPKEDIEEENRILRELRELGINMLVLASSDKSDSIFTEDEKAAIELVTANKPIPDDLRQRLLNNKKPEEDKTIFL